MPLQIFWQKVYRNVLVVVRYQMYHFCPNLWIRLVVMATERLNVRKIVKNNLLRSHKGNKAETLLKWLYHWPLQNVDLLPLLLQFKVFHWLILGKVKIGLYCFVTADIFTNILQKCPLNSPLPNISFLSNSLNLIGCHGNQKVKFEKKNSKIISSEVIRRIKLKFCKNVHSFSLYNNDAFL